MRLANFCITGSIMLAQSYRIVYCWNNLQTGWVQYQCSMKTSYNSFLYWNKFYNRWVPWRQLRIIAHHGFFANWMGKNPLNHILYINALTFCTLRLYWHTFVFLVGISAWCGKFLKACQMRNCSEGNGKVESWSVLQPNPVPELSREKVSSYLEKANIKKLHHWSNVLYILKSS